MQSGVGWHFAAAVGTVAFGSNKANQHPVLLLIKGHDTKLVLRYTAKVPLIHAGSCAGSSDAGRQLLLLGDSSILFDTHSHRTSTSLLRGCPGTRSSAPSARGRIAYRPI